MNGRYVYILLNTLKRGFYPFDDIDLKYEPFYVGHGVGNRWREHYYINHKCNRNKLSIIQSLKDQHHSPNCYVVKDNLDLDEALNLEIYVINQIGRTVDGGTLTNISEGGEYFSPESIRVARYEMVSDGKWIISEIYDKRRDAESIYGNLHLPLNNINSIVKGYVWRRDEESGFEKYVYNNVTKRIKESRQLRSSNFKESLNNTTIAEYDSEGNFIKLYPNRKFIEDMGLNGSSINKHSGKRLMKMKKVNKFYVYTRILNNIKTNLFDQGYIYIANKLNEASKRKVVLENINGDIIKTYTSIREAIQNEPISQYFRKSKIKTFEDGSKIYVV